MSDLNVLFIKVQQNEHEHTYTLSEFADLGYWIYFFVDFFYNFFLEFFYFERDIRIYCVES